MTSLKTLKEKYDKLVNDIKFKLLSSRNGKPNLGYFKEMCNKYPELYIWDNIQKTIEGISIKESKEILKNIYLTDLSKEKFYLYLLECQGYYKIGKTNNPKNRFTAIRTANPFEVLPIICIYSFDKTKIDKLESSFHLRFAMYSHRNEWFKKSSIIIGDYLELVDNESYYLLENFEYYYAI